MGRRGKFGIDPRVLKNNVYQVCREYEVLTLRQCYYRLIARYEYPNDIVFYKYLSRWTTRWRREDLWLDNKFVDPSRTLIKPPRAWREGELWLEKESLRNVLQKVAERYRIPLLIQKGFGSRPMFRDALRRTKKKGVKKVFVVLDFDPSGKCIQRVDARELGIKVVRVAITLEQTKGLVPRPVPKGDTRSKKYVMEFGNRSWEVESLDPTQLLEIVERALRREVPPEFLREAEHRVKAERITREILEPIRKRIEAEAYSLLKKQLPPDEVRRHLSEGLGISG